MNIVYKSIVLRAIEETDLEFCREMINSQVIEASTVGKNLPVSAAQQIKWYQSGHRADEIRLLVETSSQTPIGMVSLTNIHWTNRTAEVGIKLVNVQERSTENTNDVCECILSYVFEELNLHCLYANVLEDNMLSRKLLLRFGFYEEGVMRERVYKRGIYHNIVVYSMLMEEYRRRKHNGRKISNGEDENE